METWPIYTPCSGFNVCFISANDFPSCFNNKTWQQQCRESGGGGGGGRWGGWGRRLPGMRRYFAAHTKPKHLGPASFLQVVFSALPEHTGGAHSATWAELNGLWSKGLIKRRHTTCPLAPHLYTVDFAGENDAGQVSDKNRRFAANNRGGKKKGGGVKKREKVERGVVWGGHKVWALNCAVGGLELGGRSLREAPLSLSARDWIHRCGLHGELQEDIKTLYVHVCTHHIKYQLL